MCKIINFSMYRETKKANVAEKAQKNGGNIKTYKYVSKEWFEEFQKNGWGISKLIAHVIEQLGHIRCGDNKEYVFEEVKSDVKYYEMCPEIEEKHFKAPLWVKVNGEWYFIEFYTDFTSEWNLKCKWAQVGNYDVKGFFVALYGLNKQKLKRMIEKNNLAGTVKEILDSYIYGYHYVRGNTDCKASVSFGSETVKRDCVYKLVELEKYRYAILEGTELENGSKHMVLLHDTVEAKECAGYFREKYKSAGVPLLYGQWNSSINNWKSCIKNKEKLYKRLVLAE